MGQIDLPHHFLQHLSTLHRADFVFFAPMEEADASQRRNAVAAQLFSARPRRAAGAEAPAHAPENGLVTVERHSLGKLLQPQAKMGGLACAAGRGESIGDTVLFHHCRVHDKSAVVRQPAGNLPIDTDALQIAPAMGAEPEFLVQLRLRGGNRKIRRFAAQIVPALALQIGVAVVNSDVQSGNIDGQHVPSPPFSTAGAGARRVTPLLLVAQITPMAATSTIVTGRLASSPNSPPVMRVLLV